MDLASPGLRPTQFRFETEEGMLLTQGIFERISTPAQIPGSGDAPLRRQVQDALQRARRAGIERPCVVGALPFDLREPSCLFVPESSCFMAPAPLLPDVPTALAVRAVHRIPGREAYQLAVRQALANFAFSDIRKAVVSRLLQLDLALNADVDALCERLRRLNPRAYRFRVPLPDGAELIGASPELLLRRHGEFVVSNPLAGSAPQRGDAQHDSAAIQALQASDKDLREHALVVDDLRQRLAPYCAELRVPQMPSVIGTGALWHLSTRIEARLQPSPPSALELACRLHPTPAVCGFPTAAARKLIDLVEPFDRGLFTGAVGWCDADGDGEWAVTIRCGEVRDRRITLFAGAGIVDGSSPEAEWRETETKLQTMLRVLGLPAEALQTPPLDLAS